MDAERDTPGGLAALAAVGLAVCCGLPLLVGAGIVVSAAGVALGSAVLVAAGVAVGIWGWRRRRQRACGKSPAELPGFHQQR